MWLQRVSPQLEGADRGPGQDIDGPDAGLLEEGPLAAVIDELQAEVHKLKGEVAELNAKVDELQGEVHKLNGGGRRAEGGG